MRAGLKDLAISEHEDDVGILDSGESMSHHDHGATFFRPLEHSLDHFLRFRIQVRGRLVQEEEMGISDQRSGDGNPLPLTAG